MLRPQRVRIGTMDLREGWLPDEDRFQLARPQIAGLRTAGDPERRYRAKW